MERPGIAKEFQDTPPSTPWSLVESPAFAENFPSVTADLEVLLESKEQADRMAKLPPHFGAVP